MELSETDAAHVRRLCDLLDRYRPGARPVAEELVHELNRIFDAEGCLAMRPVHGELGWDFDFLYCTQDPKLLREMAGTIGMAWSPFFPTTPPNLRNRAVRTKVVHRELVLNPPTPEYREALLITDRAYGRSRKDDLGVAVCDDDVVLAWVGLTRTATFEAREIAVLDALVPSLRARLLLEHQMGHAVATQALLEAALEAIPAAAFVVRGASIAYANATGRILYDRDSDAIVTKLRESMRTPTPGGAPFAITQVEVPGSITTSLAVMRRDGKGELEGRLLAFTAAHGLTPRQADVLALLARGYGNKTIAERIGVATSTVEEHVTSLLRKTATDSRAALVARIWMH